MFSFQCDQDRQDILELVLFLDIFHLQVLRLLQFQDNLIDHDLFSGMFQGISLILNEAVGKGNVREIVLDEGILLIKRSKKHPVACVLIVSKSSKSLRQALNAFSEKFFKEFAELT